MNADAASLNRRLIVIDDNLSIHDGSLFPTSIGANPQLSIYGMVNRLSQGLCRRLTGTATAWA